MSPFAIVGFGAVAALVVGWLVVSFTRPGPRRAVIEWLSATALYVALVSLFSSLAHDAWTQGGTVALVAFGFLTLLFGAGAAVCLVNTLLSLRGGGADPSRSEQGATN